LAKAFAGEQENLNLSNSPTLSNAATQQGVILGTAAYMSPEQAKGKPADKRTDVWAFGCVVFEMLTGRSLFSADDVSQTLARVLERQPDFSSLPPNLHPKIIEMLERCLEKDLRNRYSSISDARMDIQKALADPRGLFDGQAAGIQRGARWRIVLPWVAALPLTAMIAGAVVWKWKPPEPRQVVRFSYELPEDQQFNESIYYPALAVSPDGKQLVYCTTEGLYIRGVDEFTAKLISGTEEVAQQPFFSPDGKWIGYVSSIDMQLKRIGINGRVPVVLCRLTAAVTGASWCADNTIIFVQGLGNIMRISAEGGTPESFMKAKFPMAMFPQILPDGKSVLYTSLTSATQGKIIVQSLKSGEAKELFAGSFARYISTGHIVSGLPNGNSLFAAAFDLDNLRVNGGQIPIVEDVWAPFNAQYSVSDTGTLIYITSAATAAAPRTAAAPGSILVFVDRNGREEPLAAEPGAYSSPRISRDGTQVAVTVGTGENADIWILDLVRKTPRRLTFDKGADHYPLWTPDGKKVVYFSDHEGKPGIFWKPADGTGEIEKLGSDQVLAIPSSWADKGRALVFEEVSPGSVLDIAMISMDGARTGKPLLNEKYGEAHAQISPDGRWIAYASTELNGWQIWVRPFPNVNGGKWQVSTNGGQQPRWSPDGRELLYRNGDALMAVAVETMSSFRFGSPQELFRRTYLSGVGNNWDICPDGKRFLMIKPPPDLAATGASPRKINVILNYFEELKQRAPAK
jgi:Tol biopolymer transport system component